MQTITAADLVLEPLTVAHAPEMFEVLCDPLTHQYIDHPPPSSVDHLRAVYKQLETRKSPDGRQLWLNWVVRLPGQPAMGYVQATVMSHGRAWVAYLLASLVTYGLYRHDKRQAQRGRWRIPEKLLHAAALYGGWPGALVAQQRLRHKTRKLRFLMPFWSIVIVHQLFWVYWLLPESYRFLS